MQKYDNIMIDTAELWAQMSKCQRRKVGAVIAKEGRIISVGYNGTSSGYSQRGEKVVYKCPKCNSDKLINYSNGYKCFKCDNYINETDLPLKTIHEIVIHAEANAILFAAKNGISTLGCTLYVTTAPCNECAKMIIQSGIQRVVYENEYLGGSRNDGCKLLVDCGVKVEKIEKDKNEQ